MDEVKGKAGDALREHLGGVLRNRQLTALVTDLPAETVGAVPGDLLPVAWDRDKIHQLFDSLEFKVLRERLYQTLPHGLIGATGSDPDDPLATAAAGRPEKARVRGGDRAARTGPGRRLAGRPRIGRTVRAHAQPEPGGAARAT